MIRRNRPAPGRLVFITLALASAIAGLGACAPREAPEDTWRLEPPVLELAGGLGARVVLKSSELIQAPSVMSSLLGDEVASLQFAEKDRGLILQAKSSCSSLELQSGPHQLTAQTSADVALIGLLPPMILTPENLKRTWSCEIKMRVTNSSGSSHEFGFSHLKMDFSKGLSTLSQHVFDARDESLRIKSVHPRRLVCSTWWIESAEESLGEMARATKVHGIDDRKTVRQPLCTVIEISPKARLLGYFKPAFSNPPTHWSREVLVPRVHVPNLFRDPLLRWTIRNLDSAPQVFFIGLASARLALMDFNRIQYAQFRPHWARPILAKPRLSIEGATDFKETPQGYYFRIAGQQAVRVTLHANRQERMYSHTDFSRTESHLLLRTELPILLQTLANPGTLKNVATTADNVLDSQLRDPLRQEKDALVENLLLRADTGPVLVEDPMPLAEALRLGPLTDNVRVFITTGTLPSTVAPTE